MGNVVLSKKDKLLAKRAVVLEQAKRIDAEINAVEKRERAQWQARVASEMNQFYPVEIERIIGWVALGVKSKDDTVKQNHETDATVEIDEKVPQPNIGEQLEIGTRSDTVDEQSRGEFGFFGVRNSQ